jgi:hypothetical protein
MVSVLYQIRVLLVERSEVRSVLLGVLAGSAERGAQLASG